MHALTLYRDQYGPPRDVVRLEQVEVPRLRAADARGVLVAVLASGPNFNTNFAALGLPVPVFARGDSAILHIPGSDALGIVVDAGPAVRTVKVGQAVILDSWTGHNIRGYETHDGFNAQFAMVDEERAIPVPPSLGGHSPEQLSAIMLTYGTAYRTVVERLAVGPGDSMLVLGGGKGTSFAGAQLGKALGARVVLMGSNPALGRSLIERGIADAFVDRRQIPPEVFGVVDAEEEFSKWYDRTEPFRRIVLAANEGRPVDTVFEHTGGANFPLLVSVLAPKGRLAFFGATGRGLKGEYKETFFYDGRRFVLDARWVWMRQKQVLFRSGTPVEIFSEIGLLPGRRGLVWGADRYAREFVEAALQRRADLVVVASRSRESEGLAALYRMGLPESRIIDRDRFRLSPDMPDPLTGEGTPNPAYMSDFMMDARALGRAIWEVFGPRVNPDFIVERPDQSTLHVSTFLLRDHDEKDEMSCGVIVARGSSDLTVSGSHMYRAAQARETVRLLSRNRIVMDQEDLEVVDLSGLPEIQQKMLDGTMAKPKGVALVQADAAAERSPTTKPSTWARHFATPTRRNGRFIGLSLIEEVGILTLQRPDALNALNQELLSQLAELTDELESHGTLHGGRTTALILRGSGRAFVAGADVQGFVGGDAESIRRLAAENMALFRRLETLPLPVVSIVDGFALGGGNELAMSTHYRIVTENAVIGQPEVKLGIIPGYGGMQRLPRLVGPRRAAEMAVNGESVDGRTAVRIGLAHEFHPASTALTRAYRVADELRSGERRFQASDWDGLAAGQSRELGALYESDAVDGILQSPTPVGEAAEGLQAARRFAGRLALEAMRFGYERGFTQGMDNDARLFGVAVASESGQWWVRRFLAKDPMQSAFVTLLQPDG